LSGFLSGEVVRIFEGDATRFFSSTGGFCTESSNLVRREDAVRVIFLIEVARFKGEGDRILAGESCLVFNGESRRLFTGETGRIIEDGSTSEFGEQGTIFIAHGDLQREDGST
jgi:hypothetical protein